MSSNFSLNKQKCWSCEYFCGKRQIKNGLLMGTSVQTDATGICGCKRGPKEGKKIGEDGWCSKYHRWGAIQSLLVAEQQKKQQQQSERQLQEQQRNFRAEQEREQRRLSEERERLRKEREKLEHERYLASLSPEERKRVEEEEARNRQATIDHANAIATAMKAKKQREEQQLAISANEKKLKSLRSKPLIAGIIAGAIGLGAFFFSWIPHWSALFEKMQAEGMLRTWVYLGHSSTDKQGLEYQAQIDAASAKANGTLWIPFLFLALAAGAVVLTVLMLNKSKRRKEAIATLEKEIQATKDELATVPETPPLPVGTSERAIVHEKIDERRTKSTIVVGGEPVAELTTTVTVSKPESAEELFMAEYNEEFAYLTFIDKYPAIKVSTLLTEGDYPHWMWMSRGVKEVHKLHAELEGKGMYCPADPAHFVSIYKAGKLREIASAAGVAVKGKKEDIQQQLAAALTTDQLEKYSGDKVEMVSPLGKSYMQERQLKWEYYCSEFYPDKPFEAYAEERKGKSLEDMELESINREIKSDKESYGRNAYYSRSGIFEKREDHERALIDLLTVLRIDLSGVCAYKAIKEFGDEFRDPSNSEISFAPGLLKEIESKKQWFKPSMIETVYRIKLPLDATDQLLFMEIITKLFSGTLTKENLGEYENNLKVRFAEAAKGVR